MNNEKYLQNLLGDKVPKTTEVELHLFEFCNLACSFCGQDHDSTEGMNTILEKAQQVIDFIDSSPLNDHIVNVMGGEIFNDLIDDKIFLDYIEFYKMIRNYCLANNQTVRFNFVTNLIFNSNREQVNNLLHHCNDIHLSTSYDFAGRGLDINRMLTFKENLKLYKNRIGVVGFVLSKPSIRKLLRDEDKFFKEVLYPNFPLYFDWYVPENSSDKMLPSEREMLDALLFVARQYPNIAPVKDLLENEENTMTCYSLNKTTILPSGREVTCRYLNYEQEQFITPIDYTTNADIINTHLERNECMGCEWYSRCQFRCFVQADWATLEREPTCIFKTFFNETIK